LRLNTNPDPDPSRIRGFDDQKLKKKFTAEKKNWPRLFRNLNSTSSDTCPVGGTEKENISEFKTVFKNFVADLDPRIHTSA
jgi:hypothetical protein